LPKDLADYQNLFFKRVESL